MAEGVATAKQLANSIRVLSMDAVQRAKSGHPGMPMGMADIAQVLWGEFLNHNPKDPSWANRDRFVLSNGHGSMLLYALLHLTGYDVSLDDIKNFRQLHSKTPGHPEYGITPGVETTTGPLGQGITNAVGMALAEKTLAAQFNRPGFSIVDHHTYVFMGDGCIMEGISHEACSLAGTHKLGKLIAFWDDNGISIDGKTEGWLTDDTPARFRAYGWQVIADVDGHDAAALSKAVKEAQANTTQPTLICCRTVIGFGAPNLAGSQKTHGAPLGDAEIAATRESLGWEHGAFDIPAALYDAWDATAAGAQKQQTWEALFEGYQSSHPQLAAEFQRRLSGSLPAEWTSQSQAFIADTQKTQTDIATRKASLLSLEAFGPVLPELVGGSADLTGSNLTLWSQAKTIEPDAPDGQYLYYGVREFGMSAIMNGMALHGGFIPFGGTFLTFTDYARNAVRMAGLMEQRVVFVYTHDSIGVGEDGPTHQPIEHLTMLRATPNVDVWRPCDSAETAVAWQCALEANGPSCLALSRQNLPAQSRDDAQRDAIAKGGYILWENSNTPALILMATGSEVGLVMSAAKQLAEQGHQVRVVSMPCVERFNAQPAAYRDAVLPSSVRHRIAVEAGATDGWYKFVGLDGRVIGIDRFGESAPGNVVYDTLGVTLEAVIEAATQLIG